MSTLPNATVLQTVVQVNTMRSQLKTLRSMPHEQADELELMNQIIIDRGCIEIMSTDRAATYGAACAHSLIQELTRLCAVVVLHQGDHKFAHHKFQRTEFIQKNFSSPLELGLHA